MVNFPRTKVGGISLSRLIIGTNWFLGYSHTSAAKDKFIKNFQTKENITEILVEFLNVGVDTIMGMPVPLLRDAIEDAENRVGRGIKLILTPHFNILPGGERELEPQHVFDKCRELGATFCMPHQCITDRLVDRLHGNIRDMDKYSKMIRDRDMIPGLSTHMPETISVADHSKADVETYIQIYNAAGFMMSLEADWVMRIIYQAEKPVMTIKPLAAGRLLPPVGLAFVWNTIRDCDLVTIGTTTPDEAKEIIELSLAFLEKRNPENELQFTRSKQFYV